MSYQTFLCVVTSFLVLAFPRNEGGNKGKLRPRREQLQFFKNFLPNTPRVGVSDDLDKNDDLMTPNCVIMT